MGKPADRAYVIDMPRDMPLKLMAGFWKGVESIKNGYVFDKRHSFRDRQMPSPTIWVFTNTFPDLRKMSEDRWQIWMIDWNKKLVKYTKQRCTNITQWAEAVIAQKKRTAPAEPEEESDSAHPLTKIPRLDSDSPSSPAP